MGWYQSLLILLPQPTEYRGYKCEFNTACNSIHPFTHTNHLIRDTIKPLFKKEYGKCSMGSDFEGGGLLITSAKPGKEDYEKGGTQKQCNKEPLYDPRLEAGVR